jgi:xanthine dehydrogenase accessory factor
LGRVIWQGESYPDSGVPDAVLGYAADRVLRAPTSGRVDACVQIGDHLMAGQVVATMNGTKVTTSIKGVLRGLIHPSVQVSKGVKIGDVDPRDDPSLCYLVSDKALAIGGGVLEAILSTAKIRSRLWVSSL